MLKFKDFVNFIEINEASAHTSKEKSSLRQPFWDSYYEVISHAPPKGTKPKEVIRAPFGLDSDGTAKKQIEKMFSNAGYSVDKIEMFDKGQVRQGKDLGSDIYASYKVTSKGNEYWVTNSTIETESGGEQEIGKKDLTPNKLGVINKIYHKKEDLIRDVQSNIQNFHGISDQTKNFLILLTNEVASKAKSTYHDMEHFFKSGKVEETISLQKHNYILDRNSLNNIINDFGEVLDGIYLLSTIKHIDKGLEFPEGSNEALSDMWVDGWNVSSKAEKGGGRPSIDALITVCSDYEASSGNLVDLDLTTPEENELYHIFLELSKLKGSKNSLPTVETYTFLAQKFIENGKLSRDSGFGHYLDVTKSPTTLVPIHRKTIVKNLLDLAKDGKYETFMKEFWTKCGSSPKEAESSIEFMKHKKGDAFYYPLAVEVVKILNTTYEKAMVTLVNKLLVVKQMYLGIYLDKEQIKFTSTSSDSISAVKFIARGSTKTFNAGLGYEMKK